MDNTIKKYIKNSWTQESYDDFINYLISISECKYKEFESKLIPNNNYEIIGIRIPYIRKISSYIYKTNYDQFIRFSKKKYLEEIMIISIIISKINIISKQIEYVDKYIHLLDNWCLCDTFCSSMKCIKNNLEYYFNYFKKFNNRVMIVIFLNYYLNDEYIDKVFDIINNINSDDYYINMAISWLMCEAYINYSDKVSKYLIKCRKKEIITMTNSKIRDSRRIK